MTLSRSKLIPVHVPWRISLSDPFLNLWVEEYGETRVKFVGDIPGKYPLNEAELSQAIAFLENILSGVKETSVSPFSQKWITVNFGNAPWCHVNATPPNHDILSNDKFDTTAIDDLYKGIDTDRMSWAKKYNESWLRTGDAPIPGMYEVLNSAWVEDVQGHKWDMKHYLLTGERIYIEILAKQFTWQFTEQ